MNVQTAPISKRKAIKMARHRKKKRTHVGAQNGPANAVKANSSGSRAPKSMVIRIGAGEVGPSVSQLVKDVRAMMEPDTASRLKVCFSTVRMSSPLTRSRSGNQTN